MWDTGCGSEDGASRRRRPEHTWRPRNVASHRFSIAKVSTSSWDALVMHNAHKPFGDIRVRADGFEITLYVAIGRPTRSNAGGAARLSPSNSRRREFRIPCPCPIVPDRAAPERRRCTAEQAGELMETPR